MSATQSAIDALFDGGPARPNAAGERAILTKGQRVTRKPDIGRILKLPVIVNATLAECGMDVESLLELAVGSIIEFEKSFDAELSLRVGDREIGTGQAVKVGEHFGLRLTAIDTVRKRINAMGGG